MSALSFNRPAPRWVHVWAILTVIITACLLTLGGLVTTFRAGMADPIWPTQPWYLFTTSWSEPKPGFYIEHTHRLAGFTVGGMTAILVIGLWLTDPRRWSRWLGLIGLVALLGAFGQFHMELRKQIDVRTLSIPQSPLFGMAGSLLVLLICGMTGLASRMRGTGLRILGVLVLVAVMIQGLLGGFRVRHNEWLGADLAAFHGIFAQIVFSLLVSVAVLTARPSLKPRLHDEEQRRLRKVSILLIGLVFGQLILGALIRHNPTPVVQRLHLIMAFIVLAGAIWLIKTAHEATTTWNRLKRPCLLLGGLLALQIGLGVEAWMGKFATGVLPELQKVTQEIAIVRTAHVLVGTCILATAVGLALMTRRPRSIEQDEHQIAPDGPWMAEATGSHQPGVAT